MKNNINDKIWQAVCSGDIITLETLYEYWQNKHITHLAFGIEHSLIMGALRNKEYATVNYLIKRGEIILSYETEELLQEFAELLKYSNGDIS